MVTIGRTMLATIHTVANVGLVEASAIAGVQFAV
jgi:hypothetical protein